MREPGAAVRVQIRLVPACPHADVARELVRRAAATAGLAVEVEELIGDYPSPTILVDGRDLTGEDLSEGASCRLDLPTERQILTALGRPPS